MLALPPMAWLFWPCAGHGRRLAQGLLCLVLGLAFVIDGALRGFLLSAYEALLEHVPTSLTVVGADPEEVDRRIADPEVAEKIDVLGKVSHGVLWRELGEADVLVAPSLAGESFGMVLIEAMASGTPCPPSNSR